MTINERGKYFEMLQKCYRNTGRAPRGPLLDTLFRFPAASGQSQDVYVPFRPAPIPERIGTLVTSSLGWAGSAGAIKNIDHQANHPLTSDDAG